MNDQLQQTASDETSSSSAGGSAGHPWVRLVLIALLVAGGGGVAYWRLTLPAPVAPVAEVPVVAAPPATAPAPPVDFQGTDARLASAAGSLSPRSELKDWLGEPGVLRRIVGAVQLVADGESPRAMLPNLKPSAEFSVSTEGKRQVMSAESCARYDSVAQVLASIDVQALARLYASLRPAIDGAFGEVARPGRHFDEAFGKAVDSLAAVPLSDEPLEVVALPVGVGFAFADPQLEALSPPQKHLLRMGPANARIVVAKLTEFRRIAMK